jgi:NAD(P)-dependent dehydrogenase (short-subunit alcohol dehydrogenase family)
MTEKTALVVGGTSGIGLATARRLRDGGATVHIVGRSKERLDAAAEDGLIAHRADGGDRAQITALAEQIGRIDWLVVSLTGSEGVGAFADLDLDTLRRAFDAKFWAQVTTVQAVLPWLSERGSITLLSAITARASMPGTAGIAALNGAVEALVKPLAVELAPIRVNGVSPGVVDTPWWAGLPAEARSGYFAQVERTVPARHIGTAEEVAELVAVAATNSNITGTVLETDGGARLVSIG